MRGIPKGSYNKKEIELFLSRKHGSILAKKWVTGAGKNYEILEPLADEQWWLYKPKKYAKPEELPMTANVLEHRTEMLKAAIRGDPEAVRKHAGRTMAAIIGTKKTAWRNWRYSLPAYRLIMKKPKLFVKLVLKARKSRPCI
ncbi:hypothetical protein H0N96_02515 [Candidatus Micrarchaeota archaeon]|nr:hypothetical protein [Candidatus Micrarchaeota archaeon]